MNLEMLKYLVEYFNLRQFLALNHPEKLLFLGMSMIAMVVAAHFICVFIHKKLMGVIPPGPAQALHPGPASPEADKSAISFDAELFTDVMKKLSQLLYLVIVGWGLRQLRVGPAYDETVRLLFSAMLTLAVIRFIAAFVPFDMDIYFRRHGTTLKESQARSLMPIIRGIIWAIGLTFLLDNLGCHVSTIIAGLGIVGVAVGLAGQTILSDFFSYIVILLDKPFQIGDFVVLSSGKSGSVEYLGPKTTRLRSLEGDVIVCANTEMTRGVLVNEGNIREREVVVEVGVAFTTPMSAVRRVPALLKEVVESFSQCRFDRACMVNFGSSNYLFQLIYTVSPQPGGLRAFMITQSDVNLALTEKLANENINGAYPTQSILLTNVTPAAAGQANGSSVQKTQS